MEKRALFGFWFVLLPIHTSQQFAHPRIHTTPFFHFSIIYWVSERVMACEIDSKELKYFHHDFSNRSLNKLFLIATSKNSTQHWVASCDIPCIWLRTMYVNIYRLHTLHGSTWNFCVHVCERDRGDTSRVLAVPNFLNKTCTKIGIRNWFLSFSQYVLSICFYGFFPYFGCSNVHMHRHWNTSFHTLLAEWSNFHWQSK